MEGLQTGFRICLQFYWRIDQLYVCLRALLPPTTSTVEANPSFLLSLKSLTWRILPWSEVHSTADLLAICARQLQRPDEDLEEATLHLQRIRLEGKERHDLKHRIRIEELAVRSIVLLYDTRREKDISRKLAFKWLGLYRISDVVRDKGTYMLEELNGSRLAGIFAGGRLKKFHLRQRLQLDHVPDQSDEEIPTLEEFLAGDSDSDLSDAPPDFSDAADNSLDY